MSDVFVLFLWDRSSQFTFILNALILWQTAEVLKLLICVDSEHGHRFGV